MSLRNFLKPRAQSVILLLVTLTLTGCRLKATGDSFLSNASSSQKTISMPTVTSPESFPYYSTSVMSLSGGCTDGYTVYAGIGTSTTSATCTNSQYSFVLSQSTDANYSVNIYQVDPDRRVSPIKTVSWIRDNTVPAPPVITVPSVRTTYSTGSSLVISGACSQGKTVVLSGSDSQSYVCTATQTFSFTVNKSSDALYQFTVTHYSESGVPSINNPARNWIRDSGDKKAVALYRFDSSTGIGTDSGSFGIYGSNAVDDDNLTSCIGTGVGCSGTGHFNQARGFSIASSANMVIDHNVTHDVLVDAMTIEAFVRLYTNPNSGQDYVIASKMGAAGQRSWEFGMTRGTSGSTQRLYFKYSTNGTNVTRVDSAATTTLVTTSFRHLAVTWNAGTVKFFFNGNQIDSTSASGLRLFATDAPLVLGAANSTNYLDSILDELRLSRSLRYTGSTYTIPPAALNAD